MAETRQVLRIFISSTAVDLREYRNKVRDAVLRLQNLPIAMETFSAQPGQPTGECIRMAAEADAVVCIVAHRYAYVPPLELGGDGERSITWLEVDAAKDAGKPVFAFLVDPKAVWTEVKEQDRLVSEPDKAQETVRAVQKLQEFKSYLEREHTRRLFTSPDDLDAQVTAAIANLAQRHGDAPASTARVWQPLFCHALQPAQHFRGREAKLQELKDWLQAPVTADRVVSLVAAGGTGKTALVHQAIHDATLSDRAGVFVWSFYEDPHTEAFLRAAYMYFTGEKDAPAGGMLERLQLALSGDSPHILILDGLERVQSEGGHRRRGELEDLQLKRLVRALASPKGNARALVTSRFPLVDLDDLAGAGHRAIVLDDLERPVALDVLRAWNLKGDEAALGRLIEPLNMGGLYHALSVAALGSYLGNYPDSPAPKFSLDDAKESDPKARRLSRILEQYAAALTDTERDLLARLSLFPRGVKVELLGWIGQSGGEVAGALIGLGDQQLVRHLERLNALGLVFRYETDGQIVYSAHPFLREFFRNLLSTKPESVHESVRAKLAPSLEARPSTKPSNPALLDQYELLIEQTLFAGRAQEALDLYSYGLGGYRYLSRSLGQNARGLRIVELFVLRDDSSVTQQRLDPRQRSSLIEDRGLFALSLGDLVRARQVFENGLRQESSDRKKQCDYARDLAWLETLGGDFGKALEYSDTAVSLAKEVRDTNRIKYSLASLGSARFALGQIASAEANLLHAAELEGRPLTSLRGTREAEAKLLRGDRAGALDQTRANRRFVAGDRNTQNVCRCDALLARLLLPDDPVEAARCLQDARAFASLSGKAELQLRCFHSACELQRHLGNYPQAIAEAEAGILLADTCGFGKYSIDIRLALAETYLAAGDAHKALQNAQKALDRSEQPNCLYAWGCADGLHFCGVALLRLGERELARQRLTAALERREPLGHGRVEETRRALEQLSQ